MYRLYIYLFFLFMEATAFLIRRKAREDRRRIVYCFLFSIVGLSVYYYGLLQHQALSLIAPIFILCGISIGYFSLALDRKSCFDLIWILFIWIRKASKPHIGWIRNAYEPRIQRMTSAWLDQLGVNRQIQDANKSVEANANQLSTTSDPTSLFKITRGILIFLGIGGISQSLDYVWYALKI